MKKLLNKKFILIVGSTITLLVVLTIGMIFKTKENIKTFKKDGYIISSSLDKTSKYYFEEGTSYKKNINSDLVFEDTDGKKVNVETSNFMHYEDGGIRFLKNGVIMDLDSVSTDIVPYYNITNKSTLGYAENNYYVETPDKTLSFNNVIGRITEKKYIVAGNNLKLYLAGNDKEIDGDYFEINYIKDGIIKVENKDVSYQTTAQDSYIVVNDNIKINFTDNKIYYNDEAKMSLSQMTIDGNENIKIEPSKKEEGNGEGNKEDDDKDKPNDKPEVKPEPKPEVKPEEKPDNGEGNKPNGPGGEGNSIKEEKAYIELVEASVNSNSINAKFYVSNPNNKIKGDLVWNLINTDTNTLVSSDNYIDKNSKEFFASIESLAPGTNYLLSVEEKSRGNIVTQYFQKLFRTEIAGISLQKKYITSSSINYELLFDKNSSVKSAKVSLYDSKSNKLVNSLNVIKDNPTISFKELKNNTNYKLVVDNIVMGSVQYTDKYKLIENIKTLKKTPSLSGLSSKLDKDKNVFMIGIDNIIDKDNSIKKYKYYIYNGDEINIDNKDTLEPVKVIEQSNASKVKISIDNEIIKQKTNYKFKVVAEYFDNEKTMEVETGLSDNFILVGRPSLNFEKDEKNSAFNKISGTIKLLDDNCTIPLLGRSCSATPGYNNIFKIEYSIVGSNKKTIIENVKFDSKTLEYYLEVGSLLAGQTYTFDLFGDVDLRDGNGIRKNYYIGSFTSTTNETGMLKLKDWKQNDTGIEDLINVSTRFDNKDSNNALAEALHKLTFNLYAGDVSGQLDDPNIVPIASKNVTGNLKDIYFNSDFIINTKDVFGFVDEEIETEDGLVIRRAIDKLKSFSKGKLLEHYTIEITDGYDESGENEILLQNNIFVFDTPPSIRIEENEISPTINAEPIFNLLPSDTDEKKLYDKELDDKTIVGYKVDVDVNFTTLRKYFTDVNKLTYYVCDASRNANCTIDKAIANIEVDLKKETNTEVTFYLENGTPFDVVDNKLTRGHNYLFKAKFDVVYPKKNESGVLEDTNILYPSSDLTTDIMAAVKQGATYKIYIDNSTDNQISYKYSFNDIDNTMYDNKFYYKVDDLEDQTFDHSEENFVISNLNKDSVYDIRFKRALIKLEKDIEEVTVGKYIFDGKHVYNKDDVNFELLTSDNDNRLRVLILNNELNQKYIDRISAYQITLTAKDTKEYVRVYPTDKLNTCLKDEKEYKCLVVDYANIKDFKTKNTTVNITAYYDSGLINNNFVNLPSIDTGYILQNNNNYNKELNRGNYLNINYRGGISLSKLPYGIFKYNTNSEHQLNIERTFNLKTFTFGNGDSHTPFIVYANDGIFTNSSANKDEYNVSINNKILSKIDLETTNNKFLFNSYIPKIAVNTKSLIDGAVIDIEAYGIDEEILKNEFKDESGKKYYHIKIYNEEDKFLKEEKVEIVKTGSSITLSKYLPNTKYKFKVFAYLKKNNDYKETLLFDSRITDEYESSTYEFNTLSAEQVYYSKSPSISYTSKSEVIENGELTNNNKYSIRNLEISYNIKKNIGNYVLKYELTNKDGKVIYSTIDSDISKEDNNSFDKYNFIKNISEIEKSSNEEFVFGSGYYNLKISALTEYFDSSNKQELELYNNEVGLIALQKPNIEIKRDYADNKDEAHKLMFKVSIDDNDKVIKNGTYCVQLFADDGSEIPDHPKKCGISALEKNKVISYDNLTPDTTYIFKAYANIHRNNNGYTKEEIDSVHEEVNVSSTSTDYGVSLGTFAIYSNSVGSAVTMSFSNGYNVTNIKEIDYTIMEVAGASRVASEHYVMGVNKQFITDGNNVKVVIEPEGLKLEKNKSYYAVVTFWVEKDERLVKLNGKSYNQGIEF